MPFDNKQEKQYPFTPHVTSLPLHTKKPTRPSRKQKPHTFFEESSSPVRGETALWVAVITQAMMDALSRATNKETQFHKHEAIRWLTENSKDFVDVCLCAGMSPEDVRRKAKRALVNPTPWRAEAGTGQRYMERKTYRQKMTERLNQRHASTQLCLKETATGQIIIGPWS